MRGLAHMLSADPELQLVELDSQAPVDQDVDIALYDTFAQSHAGGPGVAELVANPNVGRVVVSPHQRLRHR